MMVSHHPETPQLAVSDTEVIKSLQIMHAMTRKIAIGSRLKHMHG